jgi:hypothetical protein
MLAEQLLNKFLAPNNPNNPFSPHDFKHLGFLHIFVLTKAWHIESSSII